MPAVSKLRGHKIYFENGEWFYYESDDLVSETFKKVGCGRCGSEHTEDTHDACLGTLPGLMNACCGHGEIDEAYVQFLDGTVIQGESAKIIITELKKNK